MFTQLRKRVNFLMILFVTLSLLFIMNISYANHKPFKHTHKRSAAPIPLLHDYLGHSKGHKHKKFPSIFRTIDGSDNNRHHPDWGAANHPFLRITTVDYADGMNTPSGPFRSSARAISNLVSAQSTSILNTKKASDYIWQWGQFVDHDIDETPGADPIEAFDITVPLGDPHFDPFNTGTQIIALNRSGYDFILGVRQQLNLISSYIDASNVYGSDGVRAMALRTLDGTGKLKTSAGDLLPFNTLGLPNAGGPSPSFFLAGDVRANEQIGLTAMHVLFMREHNYWAEKIANHYHDLSGDEIYELARAIVGAEMQAITYNEFLPLFLGKHALPDYHGYKANVNASISNVFATAAYRVGHTLLSSKLLRIDANGNEASEGHIELKDAFFKPTELINHGIDSVLRGLAAQTAQEIDTLLVDDVRNFLFGPPGAGGFDLAALNIQRGRDHGLPGYNQLRRDFGKRAIHRFKRVNPALAPALKSLYGSVDHMDAWVGLLAERHAKGSMVGPTLKKILVNQFRRLRDGDRFFYLNYLSKPMIKLIEQQTLSRIIQRNTGIGNELPKNVFVVD